MDTPPHAPDPTTRTGVTPGSGDDSSEWVGLVHNLHEGDDIPEQVLATRRAAAAARRVIAGLAGTRIDAPTLDEVAAALDHLAGVLAPHQPSSRYDGTAGLHGGVGADPHVWESHPFVGPSHPLAPPLRVERHGDLVVGTVAFGHVYEGPPGAVHGGVVAAMFDLVLGAAASMARRPGLTGTLTVRYRKATPLDRVIRYEGWIDRVEERKTIVAARSTADGELLAEAEGIFVRIDGRRLDPPTPSASPVSPESPTSPGSPPP